jgi:hypothetical protein
MPNKVLLVISFVLAAVGPNAFGRSETTWKSRSVRVRVLDEDGTRAAGAKVQLCWLRTRVRKRWVDGCHDTVWPHQDDTDIPLVIVATRQLPFHYFGKVSDEKGNSVAGATVRIQASIRGPGEAGDFADSHDHCNQAVTRRDGSYDVFAAGPYVNMFTISRPGFKDDESMEDGEIYGLGLYEEAPCAPGRYDFTLKRK